MPTMLVNIAVPPYDNIGKGTPTTGNNPVTIPRFIAIYKKKLKANAQQNIFEKLFLLWSPIKVIRLIIEKNNHSNNKEPISPNSSAK